MIEPAPPASWPPAAPSLTSGYGSSLARRDSASARSLLARAASTLGCRASHCDGPSCSSDKLAVSASAPETGAACKSGRPNSIASFWREISCSRSKPASSVLASSKGISARNCSWSAAAPACTRLRAAVAEDSDTATNSRATSTNRPAASISKNAVFTSRTSSTCRTLYSASLTRTPRLPILPSNFFLPGNGTVCDTPTSFFASVKPPPPVGQSSALSSSSGLDHSFDW